MGYTRVMSEVAARRCFSFGEYLELEEASNTRHEFAGGEIYAMAGGTPEHAALAMAIGAALVTQLRDKGCRVYSSDLRVRVQATGLTTYPDLTVVWGPAQADPASDTTVLNPVVVVEVLSPSTEDYDRNDKRENYVQIPSLKDVMLVAYDRAEIECWSREGPTWNHRRAAAGDQIRLVGTPAALDVTEIYRDAGVSF